MTAAQQQGRRGLGFAPLLTLIFAAAKVFGFSTMSWLWVFSPIWIVFSLIIAIWLIAAIVIGVVALIATVVNK